MNNNILYSLDTPFNNSLKFKLSPNNTITDIKIFDLNINCKILSSKKIIIYGNYKLFLEYNINFGFNKTKNIYKLKNINFYRPIILQPNLKHISGKNIKTSIELLSSPKCLYNISFCKNPFYSINSNKFCKIFFTTNLKINIYKKNKNISLKSYSKNNNYLSEKIPNLSNIIDISSTSDKAIPTINSNSFNKDTSSTIKNKNSMSTPTNDFDLKNSINELASIINELKSTITTSSLDNFNSFSQLINTLLKTNNIYNTNSANMDYLNTSLNTLKEQLKEVSTLTNSETTVTKTDSTLINTTKEDKNPLQVTTPTVLSIDEKDNYSILKNLNDTLLQLNNTLINLNTFKNDSTPQSKDLEKENITTYTNKPLMASYDDNITNNTNPLSFNKDNIDNKPIKSELKYKKTKLIQATTIVGRGEKNIFFSEEIKLSSTDNKIWLITNIENIVNVTKLNLICNKVIASGYVHININYKTLAENINNTSTGSLDYIERIIPFSTDIPLKSDNNYKFKASDACQLISATCSSKAPNLKNPTITASGDLIYDELLEQFVVNIKVIITREEELSIYF